jgi:ribosomal protein S18 acetylase RimI-like enzyme
VADVDGRIDCLAVGQQYRQMGIGTKLITAMETYLNSQGIFEIRLTVSVHNPAAIKCYEKIGMKPYLYSMRKELK